MKTPKKNIVEKQVNQFLKENPNIKKTLDVFNVSQKEYKKAIEAVTQKSPIISSNTSN